MAHGVLVVREVSKLDRNLVRVASTSFATALAVLDQRVALYLPRNGSAGSYVGTATVTEILPHVGQRSLTLELADIDTFDLQVPLIADDGPVELALADTSGKIRYQRTAPGLRLITTETFNRLLEVQARSSYTLDGFANSEVASSETTTPMWTLAKRRVRLALRQKALNRYGGVCMLSDERMTAPEGYSLLQMSHFHPLKWRGPDELNNVGMKTPNLHSIYEAGLITILPNREIRCAPDMPVEMRKQLRGRTHASFPMDPEWHPSSECLDFHRQQVFEARLLRSGK